MKTIEYLPQFYQCILETVSFRRTIVKDILKSAKTDQELLGFLKNSLEALESIEKKENVYSLNLSNDQVIELDLDYEINELKKDVYFFEHTEEEFFEIFRKK